VKVKTFLHLQVFVLNVSSFVSFRQKNVKVLTTATWGSGIVRDRDRRRRLLTGSPIDLLYRSGDLQKDDIDILRRLRRRLQQRDIAGIREGLCGLIRHLLLVDEIAFVPNEQLARPLCGVTLDLRQPVLYVVEGIGVGHIVDDDDAVRTAIVGAGDCAETFLSGCVPDLEFDRFTPDVDGSNLEIDSNRRDECFGEGVVNESHH